MDQPPKSAGDPGTGRFEDRGEIARGGMGLVHAVWDALLHRDAALKILQPAAAADADRFIDEARIMGGLDHPNVVPVHDLWIDAGGSPRLLMKRVEGRTLRDLLREAGPPPLASRQLETLLQVVLKVCDAVSFAHSRGVIHRDLHPGNVMVGAYGQVYLMDWGLAVRSEAFGAAATGPSGAIIGSGTPAYMAPEQAWGRDGEVDERTDVFGLGGMLYELLTLRAPFAGDNFEDVVLAARRGHVRRPEDVVAGHHLPARLCDIAMRALAPARSDRHASVEALRGELEDFLRSGGWFATQRFPSGALVLEEGQPSDRAYLITDGTCEVFRGTAARTERLRVVGPGGVVGEVGLLTGSPRIASVRALTDVTALVVTRDAFEHELTRASWMRPFFDAAVARFVELDERRRRAGGTGEGHT